MYDSNFETVNSNSDDPPDIWTELITFSSFRSDYDDEDYVPELDREWLTDEEIHQRQLVEDRKRGRDTPPRESIKRRGKHEKRTKALPLKEKSESER